MTKKNKELKQTKGEVAEYCYDIVYTLGRPYYSTIYGFHLEQKI